jgi:hypothetical protein
MEKKGDGLLVNLDTTAAALTVTSVAATGAGKSKITVAETLPYDCKFMYKAAASTAPSITVGTKLTAADGWADLPADGVISTTADYKVTVALTGKNNIPFASGNTTAVVGS